MTLRRKLALFLLAASLAPVAGIAFPILAWAQREVAARAQGEVLARAQAAAGRVAADLADADAPADDGALADAELRARATGRLDAVVPAGGAAYLASQSRAALASTGAAPLDEATRAAIAPRLDLARGAVFDEEGTVYAWAPVGRGNALGVLVAVPAHVAYAPILGARRLAIAGSAVLVAAVLAGFLALARRTTAGLARFDAAAKGLGAGDLTVRLPVDGHDEFARAAVTFNAMAEELQVARGRLERGTEDLQAKIEAHARQLREAQGQLVEAQKLAAIGQLGAGVAHELNNPLTGVLGNAQLLLEALPPGHPDREPLEKIEALARRCRDITQKLLRFSQQSAEPDFRELDPNRVVSDALSLAEGHVRAGGIGMDVALAEDLPRVRGDAGHLAQVVLSLVANARAACIGKPGAGIRVSTREDQGEVAIAVEDDGKGIAPENLPRIFEPFFTTKDLWSNVGLGLSVSYRIVAEHGGRIDVKTRVGEGSLFTVRLPSVRAAA
jgi:two-component system, NtrC family, sensor kinase